MIYFVGYEGSDIYVEVPLGMTTDGLSLPWWAKPLRLFFPVWGKYGNAVLVHDYLTTHEGFIFDHGEAVFPSRERADYIFNEGLKVLGVNKIKRKAIYFAVRVYTKFTK